LSATDIEAIVLLTVDGKEFSHKYGHTNRGD